MSVRSPQVLEDGRLTDSMGRTVHFKNTLIIMTSVRARHSRSHFSLVFITHLLRIYPYSLFSIHSLLL